MLQNDEWKVREEENSENNGKTINIGDHNKKLTLDVCQEDDWQIVL